MCILRLKDGNNYIMYRQNTVSQCKLANLIKFKLSCFIVLFKAQNQGCKLLFSSVQYYYFLNNCKIMYFYKALLVRIVKSKSKGMPFFSFSNIQFIMIWNRLLLCIMKKKDNIDFKRPKWVIICQNCFSLIN